MRPCNENAARRIGNANTGIAIGDPIAPSTVSLSDGDGSKSFPLMRLTETLP